MKYTEKQNQVFIDFIKTKRTSGCTFCGHNGQMHVHECEFQLISSDREGGQFTGSYEFMPVVAIICPKCGHIDLFNAATAGIKVK